MQYPWLVYLQGILFRFFGFQRQIYICSIYLLIYRFQATKRPGILAPVVPMSFIVAYYADLAYGSKVHRIRGRLSYIFFCECRFYFFFLTLYGYRG